MTKMAYTPIYGKASSPEPEKADDLGIWYLALGMWGLQVCSNDDLRLTLTYLTSRSNLLPNVFKWDFFLKVDFLNTVEAFILT